MGVYQIAAVFEHRLACGGFLGRGGRLGLRHDCLDGVTGRHGPDQMPDIQRLKPKEQKWLRAICGHVAGMVFGLNGAFWPQAVVVAIWPLSILLLCTVLCLLMRWNFQPEKRRSLYAAALVYGLLLTNSQIEFAFAPAIPFLVMIGNQKTGRDIFLVAGILFLAGLGGILTGHFKGYGGLFLFSTCWARSRV